MTDRQPEPQSPQAGAKPIAVASESTVRADRAVRRAELFEVATEVCRKIGGIYQVLRSKSSVMVDRWRNRYTLVGPYDPASAAMEFEERPPHGRIRRVADRLRQEGITLRWGNWLILGRPRAVLLESHRRHELDAMKYAMWEAHRLHSPAGNPIVDDAVIFADAVVRFFQAMIDDRADRAWARDGEAGKIEPRRMLAHFHEWLGGLAIPELRRRKLPLTTIFTTHATLLARYVASSDEGFYQRLPVIDQAAEARRYNISCEHGYERACAHGAHIFTTVSQITAEECQHLLGRRPDFVTPNGLDMGRFNVGHEFQTYHAEYKAEIHRFTMAHFFPSYAFDLERTLYFFTSGRFEPRN